MKKTLLALACITFLLTLCSSISHAQISPIANNAIIPAASNIANPTATVTTTIAPILDLAVTTGGTVDFQFPDIASLDAGIEKTSAVSLTFRSNKPWFVNVAANAATFTGTGADASTDMPSSVLLYRLGGATSYNPLTTTPAAVTGTQGAKNGRGAGTIGIDYKMNPRYSYGPGGYSIALTYTVSNQ